MKPATRSQGTNGELGFTLLEFIIVLGILAVGAAIAVPFLTRAGSRLALESQAYGLANHLRNTRAAAQANSVEHALTIDLATRRYWAEGVVPRRSLPQSVTIDLSVPESERVGAFGGRIRFLPDGSASGARIVLKDGKTAASIAVDWLSGDVRVHW